MEERALMIEIGKNDIKEIAEAINESTGIDLSNYAFSSLKRRIERFIEINKVKDTESLIYRIKEHLSFADKMVHEITVNVTEMFRDPTFWMTLRSRILPELGRREEIKIWHAACSTGEEVCSMAILLKELGLLGKSRILATDLNRNVLDIAREGMYPKKLYEVYSRNYEQAGGTGKLSDYCSVNGEMILFDKQLIRNVDFRRQDLGREFPVSSFDLILCRNVFIYFNFELQEKVIQTFTRNLEEGSFLAIGSKESINWCESARFFTTECVEEKIYRKNGCKIKMKQVMA